MSANAYFNKYKIHKMPISSQENCRVVTQKDGIVHERPQRQSYQFQEEWAHNSPTLVQENLAELVLLRSMRVSQFPYLFDLSFD